MDYWAITTMCGNFTAKKVVDGVSPALLGAFNLAVSKVEDLETGELLWERKS